MLRSVPGLLAASQPAQLPPITYQLPQTSVWQGGPGPMGAPGQLGQLPPGVWLNPMVQLPLGVQFCSVAAPCPPAHGWGQQVVVGTLVPLQPMGLGVMVPREPLYPTAQHWVQGPPPLHTLPGSIKKPLEASDNAMVVAEDSVRSASPHLATAPGKTTTKPKAGVTIPKAPAMPPDLPELGSDAFAEAFPELAEDNLQFEDELSFTMDITDTLAWLDAVDGKDAVPEVPNSPCSTTLFQKLLEYVAEGGCPKQRPSVVGLGHSKPFLGVATSPMPDPEGRQGEVAAVLATGSALEPAVESPLENPPKGTLETPLPSPSAAPQRHPPCMAWLTEEVLRRQLRVVLTRLLLPLGVNCRGVPRSGRAGGKWAKRPALAGSPKAQETSPPPKKRKNMVVRRVGKQSKEPWEGKPDRDSMATGNNRQQAGSSKKRAPKGNNVLTKRA